ncbi:MAG: GNAT family N-acetyltransferase [Acetobacteraceae bacterium]|nr:GNAT family N-acetyltransferase [Acetobacteraceae bacterium]
MSDVGCNVVTNDRDLAALQPCWSELWRGVPEASPFQSPEWLLPWWRAFGTGRPRVAVLRGGERMLGALPLYRLDEPGGGKLLPLGAGLSDYCDALLAPDAPDGAADRLLAAALAVDPPGALARCDLIDLPPGSALRDVRAPPGWSVWREDGETCPVLALPSGARDLRSVVPASMRRKISMARHRAERGGGSAIETATPDTLGAMLPELVRLHGLRWQGRGSAGVLTDPLVHAFHRDATPRLLAAEMLRMQALRIGGKLAAVFYLLLAGAGRVFAYLGGFDPAFAYESPGTLMFAAAIEDAIREGRREFHFLRGGEAYKYAWGALDQPSMTVRLLPAGRG